MIQSFKDLYNNWYDSIIGFKTDLDSTSQSQSKLRERPPSSQKCSLDFMDNGWGWTYRGYRINKFIFPPALQEPSLFISRHSFDTLVTGMHLQRLHICCGSTHLSSWSCCLLPVLIEVFHLRIWPLVKLSPQYYLSYFLMSF